MMNILQPTHATKQLYMLRISQLLGFSKGSGAEALIDFLDVFLSDTSMNDTDALTNLINTTGSRCKAIRRKVGEASGLLSASHLFPLTAYDWNSHILSQGATCKTAVRKNIWDLEDTKREDV